MDRIEFLELSEEQLTMVAGGYTHQSNSSWNHQYASAEGDANGGNGNGNHSATLAFSEGTAVAGYNANGNAGQVIASNSNQTKQFNIA